MDIEFEDLKHALDRLDARLAQQNAMALDDRRRAGTARIQWGLWPLWLGQGLQMLFGLLCIGLGVSVWTALRDGGPLFFSAILVHAYGIACIVSGGITLGMLGKIDRGESLLATQGRIARLRRFYIVSGMVVGLSWWLFWIPFMATFFYWLARADLYANLGMPTIGAMCAVGVAGLIGTAWFHRWSRSPARPKLAKAMDDAVTGHSLARAQRRLDELKAFADE